MKYSTLTLDFRIVQTPMDLIEFMRRNQIKIDWDLDFVLARGQVYDVCYLDPITFEIFAYIKKGQNKINFTSSFVAHLRNDPEIFELDAILDKINRSGIGSLTENELNFLNWESKRSY